MTGPERKPLDSQAFLLMLALTKTANTADIQQMFDTY